MGHYFHQRSALALLRQAVDLVERFPGLLRAMESGELDPSTAGNLLQQLSAVSPGVRGAVEAEVVELNLAALARGVRLGRRALRTMVDTIIERHDPARVRDRRDAARRNRGVYVSGGDDGMADLTAHLTAEEAACILERLDVRPEGAPFADARSFGQKRADTLVELILGTLLDGNNGGGGDDCVDGSGTSAVGVGEAKADGDREAGDGEVESSAATSSPSAPVPAPEPAPTSTSACAPVPAHASRLEPAPAPAHERAPSPAASPATTPTPIRPQVTVITPATGSDLPRAFYPRSDEGGIDSLIALLTRSIGASVVAVDPAFGASDDPHRRWTYRPSDELKVRIRLRDGTCRHPGCSVAAESCEIDHVRAFDHADPPRGGPTCESNLMCLCRRHHRFKTCHSWRYLLSPDGTLTVSTASGQTVTTPPSGPLQKWRTSAWGDAPRNVGHRSA